MPPLAQLLQSRFLTPYEKEPYVARQKVKVLLWMCLLGIPIILTFMTINIIRTTSWHNVGLIANNLAFLACLLTGCILIRVGKYIAARRLLVAMSTLLVLAGGVLNLYTQATAGSNNFYFEILLVVVFVSMYASRMVLIGVSVLFLAQIILQYILVAPSVPQQYSQFALSFTLNAAACLLIILMISYHNNKITDESLRATQRELEENKRLNKLLAKRVEHSNQQLKVLQGLIPICSKCKKIRDDVGNWNQLETYICEHSEADFSHGICPECAKKLYPDLDVEAMFK